MRSAPCLPNPTPSRVGIGVGVAGESPESGETAPKKWVGTKSSTRRYLGPVGMRAWDREGSSGESRRGPGAAITKVKVVKSSRLKMQMPGIEDCGLGIGDCGLGQVRSLLLLGPPKSDIDNAGKSFRFSRALRKCFGFYILFFAVCGFFSLAYFFCRHFLF